ncbi:MAG: hypothetical protein R3E31_11960 [Chloroflexota bacterium]
MTESPQIGTLAEMSLHASLKAWYGRSGDLFEVSVDGFVVDIVRDDGAHLIEIQTGNFGAMKRKLARLLPDHQVTVVHPLAQEKWIVRETAVGVPVSRRKSPKRARFVDVFYELVHIPHLLTHPHLRLELLATQQEEIQRDDGQGSWRRRGWSIVDRRLLAVTDSACYDSPAALLALLPAALPQPFTNRELAAALNGRISLAQKITYTLTHCAVLRKVGKQGNAHLYQRAEI